MNKKLSKKDIVKLLAGDVNIIVIERNSGTRLSRKSTRKEIHRTKLRKFKCGKCHENVYRIVKGVRADLKLCSACSPSIVKLDNSHTQNGRHDHNKEIKLTAKALLNRVNIIAKRHRGAEYNKLLEVVGAVK